MKQKSQNCKMLFVLLMISGINFFSYSTVPAQSFNSDWLYFSFVNIQYNEADNVESEPAQVQEANSVNQFSQNFLTGDWGGFRSLLDNSGFNFEFVYKADLFSNVRGGVERSQRFLDNFDLIFSSDLSKAFNLHGTNLTIHVLGNGGGSPCELVGASQGISNIETTPTWKIYQFLLEQKFLDDKLSILAGLYDLNSEFDVRETTSLFINPSHGVGDELAKSGLNGPSIFPTTSLTARFKYEFENGSYIQTALLDGVPGNLENPYGTQIILNKNDGLLVINEMGIVNSEEEQLKSKIAFGGWIYTAKSEVNNLNIFSLSPNYQNNYGFYFTAESAFYSPHENSNLGLNGFVRIGYANPQVNPVDFYLGTGFKFSGLFGTDNNELGLAIAFSHNSQGFRNIAELNGELIKPYEINLEATFLMPLTPYLIIQPDIQYIINPSYCTNSNSAFVIGSRIQLHF